MIYYHMENKKTTYLVADDSVIINKKYIRWVKKMGDCLMVCSRTDGCNIQDTHKICKINNLDSYQQLNQHFK
jgi:hypothetical protein